jgi:hypothetical protein
MENIEAMLCAYIEGDLDEAGRAQIEKHLQEHPQHRKLIETLTATRDLMRDLPRAKAPPDVGEWLHGQVERSILLDDSASIPIQRAKPSRWPQWLGVAAVLLLFAALGAIVMRMVAPTFKAPVSPTASVVQPPAAPPPVQTEDLKDLAKTKQPIAQDRQMLTTDAASAPLPPVAQAAVPAQLDVQAVRRRLQNNGYTANTDANEPPAPVVLVVNSSNRSNTAAQITQFLNTQNGISWRQVPDESGKSPGQSAQLNAYSNQVQTNGVAAGSLPATRPEAQSLFNGMQNQSQMDYATKADKNAMQAESGNFAAAPTTQPATDMYVAQGMTVQLADELRTSLAGQPDVQACQVYKQTAPDFPATRPAANVNAAVAERQQVLQKYAETTPMSAAGTPTTAPAEPTTAPALADTDGVPANTPANAGGGGFGGGQSNSQMALSNIDAVIVVQTAGPVATESTPAPTTEPATATPPPATQP